MYGRRTRVLGWVVAVALVGCTAQQLQRTQAGARQLKSLTTQPAIAAVAQAAPGGQLALSVVGALAGLVGTVAGHLATRPSVSRQKKAVGSLAGALGAVRSATMDASTKAAIDAAIAKLPDDVKTILSAATA